MASSVETSSPPQSNDASEVGSQNSSTFQQNTMDALMIPYIFDLPLEVLGFFLKHYISHQDKLSLRETHPVFKSLLEEYIGFNISLDNSDSPDKFKFASTLAIRKIVIQNLTKLPTPSISISEHADVPKNDKFNEQTPTKISSFFHKIFLYPQCLHEVILKGNVDAQLFSEIIRNSPVVSVLECHPGMCIKTRNRYPVCVKSIGATPRHVLEEVDIFSHFPPPPDLSYLPKCKTLKLLLTQDEDGEVDLNCEAVLAILRSVGGWTLEKAVVQGWISKRFSVSRITLAAAEFLQRSPRLESFFLGIMYEHFMENDEPLSEEDVSLGPLIVEKLRVAGALLQVRKFGLSSPSFQLTLWKEFIKRQSHIVHLSFTVDLVEGVFSSEMFRSCVNTLNQFILRGKFSTAFDFGWIEECRNLKEICLHNLDYDDNAAIAGPLSISNLGSVPENLESLILFQTGTRTDEVEAALRRLQKLRTLVLFKTGNSGGETGINVECLKRILNCRTLNSVLLVRFVASNPLEAAELVRILQTLNDGQIHRTVQVGEVVQEEMGVGVVVGNDEEQDDLPPPLHISLDDLSELGLDGIVLGDASSDKEETENDVVAGPGNGDAGNEGEAEEGGFVMAAPAVGTVLSSAYVEVIPCSALNVHQSSSNIVPEVEAMEENNNADDGESAVVATRDDGTESSAPVANPSENEEAVIENPSDSELYEEDEDWTDLESSSASDEFDYEFDMELNDIDLENFEREGNVQLFLNVQNEEDLNNMLELLDPAAVNPRIQFGFVLDGVIDIQDTESKRSKWIADEDEEESFTYTLKISVD